MNEEQTKQLLDIARERIRLEAAGVADLADQLDEDFIRVVDLVLNLEGKVFVTGSGTSGIMARRMAHLLTVSGTPALFLPSMDALHGAMGAVTRGDLLIAISRGGSSDEINELARRVQDVGVPVVSLSSAPGSELARLAQISIHLQNLKEIDPGEIIAMGSTLVVGAWGDALANVLMMLRGHSWDQVLHSHPAGGVGHLTETPSELTIDLDD